MADILCLALLLPATAVAVYYAVLTHLGWRRPRVGPPHSSLRITVLIPAHDEGEAVRRTIRSVLESGDPARVLVVADNCTDDTAAHARAAGADVIERSDSTRRGKGHALAFGFPAALVDAPDAVVVLDADCDLASGSLTALAAALATAPAAQAAVLSRPTGDARGLVAAVGSQMDSAVGAGLARLGWSAPLRGTGMAFRRTLLEEHPWTATGLAEDAEYAARLRAAGVRVAFAAGAEVRCDAPPTTADLANQRRRWRAALSPLAWFHSKPLVLMQLAATVIAVGLVAPRWWPWAAGLVLVNGFVYGRAIRRTGATVAAVAAAPLVVARLAGVALAGAVRREAMWMRARRAGEPVGDRA